MLIYGETQRGVDALRNLLPELVRFLGVSSCSQKHVNDCRPHGRPDAEIFVMLLLAHLSFTPSPLKLPLRRTAIPAFDAEDCGKAEVDW